MAQRVKTELHESLDNWPLDVKPQILKSLCAMASVTRCASIIRKAIRKTRNFGRVVQSFRSMAYAAKPLSQAKIDGAVDFVLPWNRHGTWRRWGSY